MRLSDFEVWMATRIALNIEGEYPADISERTVWKVECKQKDEGKGGCYSSRNSGRIMQYRFIPHCPELMPIKFHAMRTNQC